MQSSALFAGAIIVTLALAGCRGESKPAEMQASLAEWSITVATEEIKPGRVHLTAQNTGSRQHELVIVKTDLPPAQLPASEGKVDETKVHVVGKLDAVAPGATGETTISLSPGKYALLCNLFETTPSRLSHFDQGMVTAFSVLDKR
jgi:hypothetical protein